MAKTPHSRDALFVASTMFCEAPGLGNLTPNQLAALHVFKHEFLAAGYRLYERISPDAAHPILVAFLQKIANELLNNNDPP